MPANPIEPASAAYAYPLLIKHLLSTPLANSPDQEIVYADKRRYNYREFARRIEKLGGALSALGVKMGSTVAVMDWDSHRYLECFFAVPMMGAVLQTVNIRLSPEQILYTLNHAGADVLLVNQEFLPVLAQIRPQLSTVKTIIFITDEHAALPDGFTAEYESMLNGFDGQFEFPDFDENARATTFYTTGTTGDPKGVYFSHRQLVLHTLGLTAALALAPKQGSFHRDDVYMPLTPMFHVHAWGLPYVATMAGVKQVYPGRYMPTTILELIRKEKVSFSHCVPTILHMLLTSDERKNVDLSGWKVIIGGAALTQALAEAAFKRGIDVFCGYGMSETCPVLSLAQLDSSQWHDDGEAHIETRIKTGRAIPLVDLRTVDDAMRQTPRDGKTTGEVVVRAPWLTQGYLHNQEASEKLWAGGWLHTQDLGHIDERGYLQVTDRIKDVIKTGGEWVSSLEIENLIAAHPGVSEVAVIAVPDSKWGERPVALIVLKPDFVGNVGEDDIRNHVRSFSESGQISRYAVPEKVAFVDKLPRTSVGKLNKRMMREQFTSGQ